MHFIYILRCADASLYIGETDDIEHRIARHGGR
jgi:predicted GIY-YIG superfamily endonuclease